jgi:hypothetical protein
MNNHKNEIQENVEAQNENQNINEYKATADIAETVATILIDKLISTAVITNKVNQTYKTLNDHCFTYLTNFINPYLESGFIFYENGIEDIDVQKNKIYFSHEPLEKINTWELIPEPTTCEMDRYANNKTKVKKYNKYTDIKMDNVKESSVAFDASEDAKTIRNNENTKDEISNNIKNKKKEKEEEKTFDKDIKENKNKALDTNKSQKLTSSIIKSSNKNLNEVNKENKPTQKIKIEQKRSRLNKYLEDNAPKKKEKEEILEISVTDDLPKEAYENAFSIINSSDENNRLRREREIQIEQRNAQRLAEIEREKKAKQKLYRRSDKDFDTNRLTFDPNGKIINLRSFNEPLAVDFASSKIKVKSEQNKRKEILELKDVVYPIQGMELNNTNNTKNDTYSNMKDVVNKVDADISKIIVEKNYEDKINKNNLNKKNNNKEKGSILPSGYNFDKFIPEVGVVITGENDKDKKEGGFEYIKKFNKPSFNELSRFISQSINSNNFSSYLNSSDLNANNKSINNEYLKTDENNYIGYKEEFNENNPLMQNVHKMNNINLKYSSPDLKKFNSLKIYNPSSRQRKLLNSYDKINTEIGVNQSIQLSKNLENNIHLKNIFDEPLTSNLGKNYIKSIDVNDFDKMNYFEKAVLPFKKFTNKRKLNEQKQLQKEKEKLQKINSDEEYINKFNSKIINNKDWGKEDEDPAKIQQKLLEEIENENKPKNLRLPRINNNRMKNLGMQIMTEGNNIRQRKTPLFGGNFK